MSRSCVASTAWVEDAATLGVQDAPSAVEQVLRSLPAAQQRALAVLADTTPSPGAPGTDSPA